MPASPTASSAVPPKEPAEPPLFSWLDERAAGILLHPTSLPGDQGIGTFDAAAVHFLDFLQAAGLRYWQVCPLGPTGYGDSPYQCFSAFAGNPYFIDLHALVGFGLLPRDSLAPLQRLDPGRVDYGALYERKWPLLFQAHAAWLKSRVPLPYGDFEAFKVRHAAWLPAYAAFRALKDHYEGRPWWEWPSETRSYDSARQSAVLRSVARTAEAHAFFQYLVFGQWEHLRAAARDRGIGLIGDVPIFVAGDSSDVWASPHLFELDPRTGHPLAVAGVPPDYFAADGQLWGNPLYRWDAHAADGYAWWLERLRSAFALHDVVRIDHFRGFDAYWRVPAPAVNARQGAWTPGPGLPFFRAVRAAFPEARIIAEDLGELTPSVIDLRERTGLPGMAILQFAFGAGAANPYLPHHHAASAVVYPGTHDNDTALGWYASAPERERDHARRYLGISGQEIGWDFIRAAYRSVARLAIFPLQDLLSLDSRARLNTPGQPQGNWQWRFRAEDLAAHQGRTTGYLKSLAELYDRAPAEAAK